MIVKPTRIIAKPWNEYPAGGRKKTTMWPTNTGIFTTQQLAALTGIPINTFRCRVSRYGWDHPQALCVGKLSNRIEHTPAAPIPTEPSRYLPRGGMRRDPESIPVGTWERQYL